MKWMGQIHYEDFIDEAIIYFQNDIYHIEVKRIYNDGSFELNHTVSNWAKTLKGAKRTINLDTGFKAKDWNWKEIT